MWITLNEPWVVAWTGYGSGGNAPSVHMPDVGGYISGHNLIKAHAEAWHTYDTEFRATQNGKSEVTHTHTTMHHINVYKDNRF